MVPSHKFLADFLDLYFDPSGLSTNETHLYLKPKNTKAPALSDYYTFCGQWLGRCRQNFVTNPSCFLSNLIEAFVQQLGAQLGMEFHKPTREPLAYVFTSVWGHFVRTAGN